MCSFHDKSLVIVTPTNSVVLLTIKLVIIYKNRMELRLLYSEGDSKFFTLFAVQLNPII